MSLLAAPLALVLVSGLLALASRLEQRRVHVLVRMTMRSKKTSPEAVESMLAPELGPVRAANGLSRNS
jgi:hypothetical protein